MLSINVSTQPIKMEFNSRKASLDLTTTGAELNIVTEAATLEIHQQSGELEIDQTPCRSAYGLRNMPDFVRDCAQAGMNSAVAAVGRIAEEGNRLASIESGENAVANMAADSTVHTPIEITLAYVPLPDIRYTPHAVEITATNSQLTISSHPGSIQGDFRPGRVDINVAQYPSINIWTGENKVNMKV